MSTSTISADVRRFAKRWIGVDFDHTLVKYDTKYWGGPSYVGEPVMAMVEKVRAALAAGEDVRILSARVAPFDQTHYDDGTPIEPDFIEKARAAIESFCLEHFGMVLPITATKDMYCKEIWDDIAFGVIRDTGEFCSGCAQRRMAA